MKRANIINSFLKLMTNKGFRAFIDVKAIENDNYCTAIKLVGNDNLSLSGYGQASNKDQASFLAVMELIERYIFINQCPTKSKAAYGFSFFKKKEAAPNWNLMSSSGYSVHTDRGLAIENSVNEIIERHVILKSLLTKTKPMEILNHDDDAEFSDEIDCRLFAWQGPLGRYIVLTRLETSKNVAYGFGCHAELTKSKEKSYLEAAAKAPQLLKNLGREQFIRSTSDNFLHHWNNKNLWTDEFFKNCSIDKMPTIDEDIKKSDIWIRELSLPEEISSLGIYATQAQSDKLQGMFSGCWDIEKINKNAFNNGFSLPPEMHMIG